MYKTIVIKNNIDTCIEEIKNNVENLTSKGSLFCIVKTQYKNDTADKDFTDLIKYGISSGLSYINTIVIPELSNTLDNVMYCVWFAKDKAEYLFNKDPIREKSIWKDVEWGKREKNYNLKGKDPGNVWIPTEDDGKANITNHILLDCTDIFNRLLSTTLDEKDKYLLIVDNKELEKYKYNNNGTIRVIKNTYFDISFGKPIQTKVSSLKPNLKVIFGTSEKMDKIEQKSVDMVVTSPPYWDLKDYYKKNQIGQESYELYAKRMYTVWRQCFEKLKDEGSLWININIRTRNGKPILLPQLFIEQCKKIGFIYRGILIWHKSSGIPTHAKNLSDHHEYVLIFTKTKNSKININEIAKYNDYKNKNISGKLFWNINRKAGSIGKNTIHPAIFPTELINRIIKVSTFENDLVLDPFLGSGTSLIAAANCKRNFIGYEFNEGFKDLMNERFNKEITDIKENKPEYIYSL